MALVYDAIRFSQAGRTMYLTAMPVGALVEHASGDRYDPQKVGRWRGYQRKPIDKHVDNIAQYVLRRDALMPVAGLLNVRQARELRFLPARRGASVGKLRVPDDVRLWVVDMQHRLAGFEQAIDKRHSIGKFVVPVVIVDGLGQVEEAVQFYIINTQARRLGVDLARRLLIEHDKVRDVTDVRPWLIKAVQVTILLNTKIQTKNPWWDRIREPNVLRRERHMCGEKLFVPSLRTILTHPRFSEKRPATIARYLAAYWEGIRELFPEAFENPKRYVIQKSSGIYSLNLIAPLCLNKLRRTRQPISPENVVHLFAPLRKMGSRFWHRRNVKRGAKRFGTGGVGFANLANYLLEKASLGSLMKAARR